MRSRSKLKKDFFSRFRSFLFPIGIAVAFFLLALVTIGDYGMNWDSPVHFARGQAFLRYFLTGKTDYKDAPKNCLGKDGFPSRIDYKTNEVCDLHRKTRVSEYESTILDFNYFKTDIYGHPPTSDLFLAASNMIFFKWLGWVEDMHAYHIYNIFSTFLLAVVLAIWVRMTFGTFAASISVLALYTFPLLFGEQQFNVKDPPMAAFFTLSLFLFWLATTRRSWKYMILSAVAGGISFGTKFNFVFAPFILLPWFLLYVGSNVLRGMKKEKRRGVKGFVAYSRKHIPLKLTASIIVFPVIVFLIFYLSWPVLWADPIHNIELVVKFYQDIGGGTCPYIPFSGDWITKCSDMIPLTYVLTTVPLVTLFFLAVGIPVSAKWYRKFHFVTFLWLTFIIFILGRVTLPFSKTYGGLRQVIEFIAPMAMISGIGALSLRRLFFTWWEKRRVLKGRFDRNIEIVLSLLLLLLFVPILFKLRAIHPNENVYFNSLMGGLKGAYDRNFYGYGNTYGNAYYQAARWLNANASSNSKVVLLWGLNQNISRQSLRPDVTHLGAERSGYSQKGEYQVTTMEQGNPVYNTYRYKYADMFLEELYHMDVDGVPLLRIWKNDASHLKKGVSFSEKEEEFNRSDNPDAKEIVLDLPGDVALKRIELRFIEPKCRLPFIGAKILYGSDKDSLISSNDEINDFTRSEVSKYNADFTYLFAADTARTVHIVAPANYSCNLSDINIHLFVFSNDPNSGKL